MPRCPRSSRTATNVAMTAALAATCLVAPAVGAGSASAACRAGQQFTVTSHERVFIPVTGTRLTTEKVGRHRVSITKGTKLSATYVGVSGKAPDGKPNRGYLLATVQEAHPKARGSVPVSTGHALTFRVHRNTTVSVVYGSQGYRVTFKKYAVTSDCKSTLLGTGSAVLPRKNLDWLLTTARGLTKP
jgi:hypothetical protein